MSALGEVVAALDPELAVHAVAPVPSGRFEHTLADADRAFVMEAVYEGYLLHHGEPRVFGPMDPDLRLLAGDALYALGLARLAQAGDLDAVGELAELITLSARAEAEGRSEQVAALWDASAATMAGRERGGVRAAFEGSAESGPG